MTTKKPKKPTKRQAIEMIIAGAEALGWHSAMLDNGQSLADVDWIVLGKTEAIADVISGAYGDAYSGLDD
jgi:hypothetical protein